MIGKIEKAVRYSSEPERIIFNEFRVTLHGDHRNHLVSFNESNWTCDCETFEQSNYCSHTMTMERVLRNMLPHDAESAGEALREEIAEPAQA
jgi:hypothetical protein